MVQLAWTDVKAPVIKKQLSGLQIQTFPGSKRRNCYCSFQAD